MPAFTIQMPGGVTSDPLGPLRFASSLMAIQQQIQAAQERKATLQLAPDFLRNEAERGISQLTDRVGAAETALGKDAFQALGISIDPATDRFKRIGELLENMESFTPAERSARINLAQTLLEAGQRSSRQIGGDIESIGRLQESVNRNKNAGVLTLDQTIFKRNQALAEALTIMQARNFVPSGWTVQDLVADLRRNNGVLGAIAPDSSEGQLGTVPDEIRIVWDNFLRHNQALQGTGHSFPFGPPTSSGGTQGELDPEAANLIEGGVGDTITHQSSEELGILNSPSEVIASGWRPDQPANSPPPQSAGVPGTAGPDPDASAPHQVMNRMLREFGSTFVQLASNPDNDLGAIFGAPEGEMSTVASRFDRGALMALLGNPPEGAKQVVQMQDGSIIEVTPDHIYKMLTNATSDDEVMDALQLIGGYHLAAMAKRELNARPDGVGLPPGQARMLKAIARGDDDGGIHDISPAGQAAGIIAQYKRRNRKAPPGFGGPHPTEAEFLARSKADDDARRNPDFSRIVAEQKEAQGRRDRKGRGSGDTHRAEEEAFRAAITGGEFTSQPIVSAIRDAQKRKRSPRWIRNPFAK